jgi:hypothetical protein
MKYIDKYVVKPNQCSCHPETCNCNPWAIYCDDTKFVTIFNRQKAELIKDALNFYTSVFKGKSDGPCPA